MYNQTDFPVIVLSILSSIYILRQLSIRASLKILLSHFRIIIREQSKINEKAEREYRIIIILYLLFLRGARIQPRNYILSCTTQVLYRSRR